MAVDGPAAKAADIEEWLPRVPSLGSMSDAGFNEALATRCQWPAPVRRRKEKAAKREWKRSTDHDAGGLADGPQVDFAVVASRDEHPARLAAQRHAVHVGRVRRELLCDANINENKKVG